MGNKSNMGAEKENKNWRVPFSWTERGYVTIRAKSAEEALEKAESGEIQVPEDGDYVDFTLCCDADSKDDIEEEI